MRHFDGQRLVIATHNRGKLGEFTEMLSPYVKDIIAAGDVGLPEPEETGTTFAENALLKAHAAAQASGTPALADDSGLCVAGLGNKPGIYSARWGGPHKDFSIAMARIHHELGASSDRSAHFVCVLALAWPGGHIETVEGRVDGYITWPPRGDKGHGYDPFFVPVGHTHTFAEMASEEKHAVSHRGIALRKIIPLFGA